MQPSPFTSPQANAVALFRPALLTLLLTALVLLAIGQFTDIDLILADWHFDPVRQAFPWDNTWFGRNFMHGWVKNIVVWSGFLLMAASLSNLIFAFPKFDPLARARLWVLTLTAALEPLLVRSLKSASALHCPWGVDRYGGSEPFLRLLDAIPAGWNYGHCFPAGHASAGMWLMALAVLWLPNSPKKALLGYLGGLSFGLALGWVQQMRGQHFLTHTLWTAWLSSALLLALIAIFSRHLLLASEPRWPAPAALSGEQP